MDTPAPVGATPISIGAGAFAGCTSLKTLPGLEARLAHPASSIGNGAFHGCPLEDGLRARILEKNAKAFDVPPEDSPPRAD